VCGAGANQSVCRPANGRAGSGDIVDQKDTQTAGSASRGEAASGEPETVGATVTRLPTHSVSPQKLLRRNFQPPGHLCRQQLRGRPRAAHSPQGVGRDEADDINRSGPGLSGDRSRETNPQGTGEIVVTSVFERHDNRAKDTVVLPPDHRCPLRRWLANALQAFLRALVGWCSALPTGGPGTRHHGCPTCCAQTPISSRQLLIAVWTETGKQRFGCSGQNAPRLHSGYRIRSDVATGGGSDGRCVAVVEHLSAG
jgi:hypothetical protein